MDDDLKIVMSPVQLAAAVSESTVTEPETWSNRILGGIGVVMGAAELVGATALCIAPEPTGLTKAGCVVVGAHSLDTINSSANQMINGREVRSATYQLAVETAEALGADKDTAYNIGFTVDIAVPVAFGLAIGAVRVAHIRAGRVKLVEHEAIAGAKKMGGGHTIAKHIAQTDEQLLARLKNSPTLPMASSFTDVKSAEKFISACVRANRQRIINWSHFRENPPPLVLIHNAGRTVGYGFKRNNPKRLYTNLTKVVFIKKSYNGKPYFILTTYPDLTGIL